MGSVIIIINHQKFIKALHLPVLISNSPYCLSYCDISLENMVLDRAIIL